MSNLKGLRVSKYLRGGMHLVYLDQCVVSRFLETKANEPWRDLTNLILQGHHKRKLLCPMSLEHLVETSSLTDANALSIDDLVRRLSFGWSLAPEPRLIARQITVALRTKAVTRAQFLQKGLWRPLRTPGALDELRKLKVEMDAHNAWVMQGVNEVNALIRHGKRADREMQGFLVARRSTLFVNKFLAEISRSEATGRVEVTADQYNNKVANWASLVLYALLKEERLTRVELMQLRQRLESEGLEFIPTLKIKAQLEAIQFYRREKIEPRDQYDITRSACALPYADVLITDAGKATAIRELELDTTFKTDVFSLSQSESERLETKLREIIGGT